jgi:hypothetical protein
LVLSGRSFRKLTGGGVINFSALFEQVDEAYIKAVIMGESACGMFFKPARSAFKFLYAGSVDVEQNLDFFRKSRERYSGFVFDVTDDAGFVVSDVSVIQDDDSAGRVINQSLFFLPVVGFPRVITVRVEGAERVVVRDGNS